jgi:hypothetical protein
MIDIEKAGLEYDHGCHQIKLANSFICKFCDQVFDADTFSLSVFLYGIFVLVGEKKGYAGINCPKCLKTQLMTADQTSTRNFYSEVSLTTFRVDQTKFPIELRYHSTGHDEPGAYGDLAEHYLLSSIQPVQGATWEHIQSSVRSEICEAWGLGKEIAHSFYFDEHPPIGLELSDLRIFLDDIQRVVEIENSDNKRIIPRYIHKMPIYDLVDAFYWDYAAQLKQLKSMKRNADQNYQAFIQSEAYQKVKDNSKELKKLMDTNPNITANFILEESIENYQEDMKWDSVNIPSDFIAILTHRQDPWDIPSQNHPATQKVLGSQHPFKDIGVPLNFFDSFQEKFNMADEKTPVSKTAVEVQDYFKKGYGQQFFKENYLDFINEYGELLRTACFSYAAVKDLQAKYLEKAHTEMKTEYMDDQRYAFYPTGPAWAIKFDGRQLKAMRNGGLKYIHFLLERKRQQFHTDQLAKKYPVKRTKQHHNDSDENQFYDDDLSIASSDSLSRQEKIDDKAKASYDAERKKLQEARNDAKNSNDPLIQKEAQAELDKFLSQYNKDVGKGGKIRAFTDKSENDKDAITKAIDRALKAIKKYDEEAFKHLNDALKPINDFQQCYNPREDVDWHLG